MAKGIWEHKDFWTSNPFDSSTHYIDEHGVVWLVEIERLGSGSGESTRWRARPESNPVKYGVGAGEWPVSAVTTSSRASDMQPIVESAIDGWVDKYKGRLTSAAASGASGAAKPKGLTHAAAQGATSAASGDGSGLGTLLLVLLGLYIIGSDRRRYVSVSDERWF